MAAFSRSPAQSLNNVTKTCKTDAYLQQRSLLGCVYLSPLFASLPISLYLQLEYDIEDVSKEGGGVGKC